MRAEQVKCRRIYETIPRGAPSEILRVIRREIINGETWFHVRFLSDGGRLVMHPESLRECAPNGRP